MLTACVVVGARFRILLMLSLVWKGRCFDGDFRPAVAVSDACSAVF